MGVINWKYIGLWTALMLAGPELCAQQESFDFLNASATSYSDGAYVGDNGSLWTYAGVRAVRNQFAIEGTSMGFGDQAVPERFVQTLVGAQGIGDLQLQIRSYFTAGTATDRTVRVLVNEEEVGRQTLQAMGTVEDMVLGGIDVEGPLSLRIEAVGPRQIVIDNLAWTPVPPPQPAPPAPLDLSWVQSSATAAFITWRQPSGIEPRGYVLLVEPTFAGEWPQDGVPASYLSGVDGMYLLAGDARGFELQGLQPGIPYSVTLVPWSNNGTRTRYTSLASLPTLTMAIVHTAQWPIPADMGGQIEMILRELLGYPPGPDELQFWQHRFAQVGNLSVWLEEVLRMPHLQRQREFLATHQLWWGHFPHTRYWYVDVQRDMETRAWQGLPGLVLWLADNSMARPVQDDAEQFRFFWGNRHGREPTLAQELQAASRMQGSLGTLSADESLQPVQQLLIELARERPGTRTPVIAEPPNANWYLASRLALLVYHFWPYAHGAATAELLTPYLQRPLEDFVRELWQHPHYLHRQQFYWLGAWGSGTGFALPGLGWFWYDEESWPWVWFAAGGWCYVIPGQRPEAEAFVWNENFGWLYLNREWMPWMFSFGDADWRYGWSSLGK